MEKIAIKKSNIVFIVLLSGLFLIYDRLFIMTTVDFTSKDGVIGVLDIALRMFAAVSLMLIMTFKDNEKASFVITLISEAVILLLMPSYAFPLAASIAGVWAAQRVLDIDLKNKKSLIKTAFVMYIYAVTAVEGIISTKFSYFPLINTFVLHNYLMLLIAAAVTAIPLILLTVVLSKVNFDLTKLETAVKILFVLCNIIFAFFILREKGKICIDYNFIVAFSAAVLIFERLVFNYRRNYGEQGKKQ